MDETPEARFNVRKVFVGFTSFGKSDVRSFTSRGRTKETGQEV